MRWAVAVGVIWGVFCGIANGWPVASTLAQMAVPWIWVAALVGHRAGSGTKQAAVLGGVTLLAANVSYFAVGLLAAGFSDSALVDGFRFFALWASVGLVIGPISGVVGWWLTAERTAFIAVVSLATVSVAEPLALWPHLDHVDARIAYIILAIGALTFPMIWFRRKWRGAFKAVALVIVLTYPSAVALEAVLIAFQQISPPMRLV